MSPDEQILILERALRACWDEYHEVMPEGLYEEVKAVLRIRVFEAKLGDQIDGTMRGGTPQ